MSKPKYTLEEFEKMESNFLRLMYAMFPVFTILLLGFSYIFVLPFKTSTYRPWTISPSTQLGLINLVLLVFANLWIVAGYFVSKTIIENNKKHFYKQGIFPFSNYFIPILLMGEGPLFLIIIINIFNLYYSETDVYMPNIPINAIYLVWALVSVFISANWLKKEAEQFKAKNYY